jgi:AcrR family transcriptional regulator
MARWEPNAPGRLQQAAFELFTERGYDQTTLAEITARAGLSQRTFFRHFADKREVVLYGADTFSATVVDAASAAPFPTTALDAVAAGVKAAGSVFPEVGLVRRRQELILANAYLQERELIKLASLATSLAEALRRRGADPQVAELAAEAGIVVLRVAVTRWIEDPAGRPWEVHVDEAMDQLGLLTAERLASRPESEAAGSSGSSAARSASPAHLHMGAL